MLLIKSILFHDQTLNSAVVKQERDKAKQICSQLLWNFKIPAPPQLLLSVGLTELTLSASFMDRFSLFNRYWQIITPPCPHTLHLSSHSWWPDHALHRCCSSPLLKETTSNKEHSARCSSSSPFFLFYLGSKKSSPTESDFS